MNGELTEIKFNDVGTKINAVDDCRGTCMSIESTITPQVNLYVHQPQ